MISRLPALLLAAGLSLLGIQAATADDVMLVVDASASMGGNLGTERKIDLVATAVQNAVADFPTEARIGLLAFGAQDKRSCTDARVLVPPQRNGNDLVANAAAQLQPRGRAPLAVAVERAANALNYKNQRATIIVFADRVEACDADPCTLAEALKAQAKDLTVEVIGLGLDDKDIGGVACLADKTGGHFINAEDSADVAGGLAAALAGAKLPPANLPVATLDAPAKVFQSQVFSVGYSGPEEDGDRVQISWPGLPPGSEIRSVLAEKDGKQRSLTAPAEPGTYELRYYDAKLNLTLLSKPLEVALKPVTVSLPGHVAAGAPITIAWTGPAAGFDDIRIAPQGAAPDARLASARLVHDSGNVSLDAPTEPGSYEARYYSAADGSVAASTPFTVDPPAASVAGPSNTPPGATLVVTWKGPAARYDDVVIARPDMVPGDHVAMARIRPDRNTVKLVAPKEAGTYELRYIAGDGRAIFARAPLTVE